MKEEVTLYAGTAYVNSEITEKQRDEAIALLCHRLGVKIVNVVRRGYDDETELREDATPNAKPSTATGL